MTDSTADVLRAAGVARGGLVAVALVPGVGVGLAVDGGSWAIAHADPASAVAAVEAELRPRWVVWDGSTAATLVAAGVRVATAFDVSAVHRLLDGGWRAGPARAWAALRGLPSSSIPALGQLDLLSVDAAADDGDPEVPVRPDGHLRPEWTAGGWAATPERLAAWAATALAAAAEQDALLAALPVGGDARSTARSESAAELLCAELAHDGLPIDMAEAERIIGDAVGPRPRNEREADERRRARDAEVMAHAPYGGSFDLRNPLQVRAMLRQVGVDVPDTRAWRLEGFRDVHPLVAALLTWRKAERIATTYGWGWLDSHVVDGRLRGGWSGSDGAAGRMTAEAGLHNLPAEMRPAVAAGPGHVFVRADLGQIEPRVLAAVSGDAALAKATQADDLYAPVARRLGVERDVAKVAVLAAMYGQTSGVAGQALKGLERAYPTAMGYLRAADDEGRAGRDVRTFGGRLVRMGDMPDDLDAQAERSLMAARGRYARNAMVQGAAAELFKAWAATVRARAAVHDARIVLCLHDELLVHAPVDRATEVARLVDDCLVEATHRWAPNGAVRFVADTSTVARWSEAK